MRRCILRPGKEKALWQKHPWIFSGAIQEISSCEPGEVLPVYSSQGTFLAQAMFQPELSLAGRVLSWTDEPIEASIESSLVSALTLREKLIPKQTTAFRLINAEGDGLPGLICDRYGDVLVLQISTAGMERFKPLLLNLLKRYAKPQSIREKSSASSRILEGLPPEEHSLLWGKEISEVQVQEYGIQLLVDLVRGQKTGFFLDQREERRRVEELAQGRKVLNCFSYSGGFSLAALRGGASSVTTVDVSEAALELYRRNLKLNGFSIEQGGPICKDVFHYLREQPIDADFVILDPPAFAKKHKDIPAAIKGYRDLNRTALRKMPEGSLLLTCSCSGHMTTGLFNQAIAQAATEAKRFVRVIARHAHAFDHPTSLFHPEGEYLKSLLLWVGGSVG